MKKLGAKISKYSVELLIVAFGVFLGTYVGEWKSNQRTKKNTAKSVNFIIEELKANSQSLSEAIT